MVNGGKADLPTAACIDGVHGRMLMLRRAMQAALTVVMAASGYPGSFEKGSIIRNLDAVRGAKVLAAML